MFYKLFVLGLVICVQLYIIDYVFNVIPLKEGDNNYEFKKTIIDLCEIILMVIIASLVLHLNITELPDPQKMFSIILVNSVIILIWMVRNVSWAREFLGDIDLKYSSFPIKFNFLNENSLNSDDNDKTTLITESDNVIFSKYIKKPDEMANYTFKDLYNRHNDLPKETKKVNENNKKDYSMYNGYPENHICYGCGCMKRDNGYRFCGKELPGIGTIGCSSRWECRNCKNCESANDKFNKKYGCEKCKCHKTTAGLICGTKSKLTGYIQKCNSSCAECDVCYGSEDPKSNSNVGYKTVEPSSNLKNVIININKVDIDNIFD